MGKIRHQARLIGACCQGYSNFNGLSPNLDCNTINVRPCSKIFLRHTRLSSTYTCLDCISKFEEDIVNLVKSGKNGDDFRARIGIVFGEDDI